MIIGLTGKNASGKGATAEYLKARGFVYHSLSDIIREEATKRGLDHSRDNLIMIGNDLRQKFAPSYLAEQINLKIKSSRKKSPHQSFVVDSIRNPHEARELMKNKDFVLAGVDAPIELRFKRMADRGRVGDAKTVDDLKKQEARENSDVSSGQQLDATFAMAKKIIVNDGTLGELHKKIDNLLGRLRQANFMGWYIQDGSVKLK